MTIRKVASLAACLCALLTAPARAAVVWTDTVSGTDSGSCGSAGSPCKTIQFAVTRAANGDTVRVKAGTYNEYISLAGRQVTLLSDAFATSGNRAATIIDCAGLCDADSGFYIPPVYVGNGSTLTGFTVKNGGGTGVEAAGSVTITQNIITGNQALGTSRGGGISIYSTTAYTSTGTILVENNDVFGNSAPELGGGIFVRTKTQSGRGLRPIVIQNNTVRNNTTGLAKGRGSGIFVRAEGLNGGATSVVITQNTITGNTSTAGPDALYYPWGGGISAAAYGYGTHNIQITSNTIDSNSATVGGGAALFTNLSSTATGVIQFSGNTVRNNSAFDPSALYGFGGGAFAYTFGFGDETINLQNNTFTGNDSLVFGGGMDLRVTPSELGVQSVTASGNVVTGNTSSEWGGGVFAFLIAADLPGTATGTLSVLDNTVASNTATRVETISGAPLGRGGGIFATTNAARSVAPGTALLVQGNTVRANRANLVGGGMNLSVVSTSLPDPNDATSVAAPAQSILRAENNLITANLAASANTVDFPASGGGIFTYISATGQASSSVFLDFNTISGNTSDIGGGGIEIESFTDTDDALHNGAAAAVISNSIVIDNNGFGAGGPVPGDPGTISAGGTGNFTKSFGYNDFFANSDGNFEAWLGNPTGSNGNISVNPSLDSTFTPSTCSPVVDAADPAADFSLEPAPNGGRANMGHLGGTSGATRGLADINGDSLVDGIEVLRIATSFASVSPGPRYSAAADINADGQVDGEDLAAVASQFGQSCQ